MSVIIDFYKLVDLMRSNRKFHLLDPKLRELFIDWLRYLHIADLSPWIPFDPDTTPENEILALSIDYGDNLDYRNYPLYGRYNKSQKCFIIPEGKDDTFKLSIDNDFMKVTHYFVIPQNHELHQHKSQRSQYIVHCCHCNKLMSVFLPDEDVENNRNILNSISCTHCVPKDSSARDGINESTHVPFAEDKNNA